jgi:hypothetical protein
MPRWNSCNILHAAADARRLWQFDVKGGGVKFDREHRASAGEPLPARSVAKSWSSLWQPRMNVAWLPAEHVFLRVIELPQGAFAETLAMAELQLEKLSPLPVTQIVWTIHVLQDNKASAPAQTEEGAPPTVPMQSVVVVIAERSAVEEFLGQLEQSGYLADRLEVPMLDQLESATPVGDGVWIYPQTMNGQSAALVACRGDGALRHLSFLLLPSEGDRAKNLKDQLAQLCWAGEMEGWLKAQPQWHLVADTSTASEWENLLASALNERVPVTPPPPPAELAARTARRATAAAGGTMLPADYSIRYHQQFVDRLWLRGLAATGVLYAIGVVIYFCATTVLGYQTRAVEQQVTQLGDSYTNVLELRARYNVLKERQALKFAALDCWKIIAENLPEGLTLQRTSFAGGQRLTVSGMCTPEQIGLISDPGKFYDSVRKAKLDGQDMFEPTAVEPLIWNQSGNNVSWHFTLQLKHREKTE